MTTPTAPFWGPLEQLAEATATIRPHDYMWMGCSRHNVWTQASDGTWCRTSLQVQRYKHRDTRRYLNLDSQGHAFTWLGDSLYQVTAMADAVVRVLS